MLLSKQIGQKQYYVTSGARLEKAIQLAPGPSSWVLGHLLLKSRWVLWGSPDPMRRCVWEFWSTAPAGLPGTWVWIPCVHSYDVLHCSAKCLCTFTCTFRIILWGRWGNISALGDRWENLRFWKVRALVQGPTRTAELRLEPSSAL